ncbi:MAG: class I SAM-dependent methyltransferase [Verrucomicrobia bacterium]|nr:class I SAM-dependent methyltransferase [Verrucomicrobiota bacterium]
MNANLQRFTGFADTYDKYRPAPPLVIREILSRLASEAPPLRVIDLGAGTGLSTRLWKGFEATVIGIEPSADMRQAFAQAQALDTTLSNLVFQEGTSTNTGLPDAFANIVTISQALHWMEPEPTFAEIARILRPGGVFAAIDYDWPPTIHPALEVAFQTCMAQAKAVEKARAISPGVQRWHKDQHLLRMQASRRFGFTKEIFCHSREAGGVDRLIGLAKSQSTVAALLKHGLSEDEIGISDLRKQAQAILAGRVVPWWWSFRMRVGIKNPAAQSRGQAPTLPPDPRTR